MELKKATIDLGSVVHAVLETHRESWLTYYRDQRTLIARLPDSAGAGTMDQTRWSDRIFNKALEWAALNPADLGYTVWSALQSFLRRLGTLYGVKLTIQEDTSGSSYIAIFEGPSDFSVQRAKEAAAIGATQFKNFDPKGGYLYWWSMSIEAPAEIALFQQKEQLAYDYLAVRTAALIEHARENDPVIAHCRNQLVPAIAEQFGVDQIAAQRFLDQNGIAADKLKTPELRAAYDSYSAASKLNRDIANEFSACLSRARQARMALTPEYQRALMILSGYSQILQNVARDPRGSYDVDFASELGATAGIEVEPSTSVPKDLPFRLS